GRNEKQEGGKKRIVQIPSRLPAFLFLPLSSRTSGGGETGEGQLEVSSNSASMTSFFFSPFSPSGWPPGGPPFVGPPPVGPAFWYITLARRWASFSSFSRTSFTCASSCFSTADRPSLMSPSRVPMSAAWSFSLFSEIVFSSE